MALAADLEVLALAAAYVAGVTLAFAGNRTMLHVATGNVAWFALLLEDPRVAFAGAVLLTGAAAWAWLRPPRLYLEVMGGERDSGPLSFFAAAALLTGLWVAFALPAWWVAAAFLCMAFADPVGFYAGRAFGKHRLPNGKSVEGFAAVLAAAVLVALALEALFAPAMAGPMLARALLVALGAAVGEAAAPRHTDNLAMPLGALAGLALSRALLP